MSEQQNILEGIRVVEAATMILGPSAAMVMADYGAEVIKVETPGIGDANRYLHLLPGMPESELAYSYFQDNRNKKSIALNLKEEDGRSILRELLETADVFVSNFRLQAVEKLGLTYEDVQALNPRLIYAYANGYGEFGPEANKPGYDTISYWSRTGLEVSLFPYEGWLGSIPPGTGDHPTGMTLFGAIMLALFERERTGRGRKVTTSLLANGIFTNACIVQAQLCGAAFREPVPREQAYSFAYIYYRSKDDRVFKLAIVNMEKLWPAFCRAIGRPDLIDDPRFGKAGARTDHMAEFIAILDEIFAQHDIDHWKAALTEHDIPFAVLGAYEEVVSDPQTGANEIFVEIEHPRLGPIRSVNSPIQVHGVKKAGPVAAPEIGQHSREVVAELGYSPDEVEDLLKRGVIDQADA